MTWDEFLLRISQFKRDYEGGQIDLRAASLVTLLFAGSFDSMVGKPITDIAVYRAMAADLLIALGSKAALPKAKKDEVLGIATITSEIELHLWRAEVNPVYKFDMGALFDDFLKGLRFEKKQSADISFLRPGNHEANIAPCPIFKSLRTLFDDQRYAHFLTKKGQLVGVVGIVKDYSQRVTKSGRAMGIFKLFTGDGLSPPVYIWPAERDDNFLPHRLTMDMKNGKAGLALLKPGRWNNNPQFTLVAWMPSSLKTGI